MTTRPPAPARPSAGGPTAQAPAGGVRDPVGTADRLRSTVGGRVAELLAGPAAGAGRVHVGWFAAQDARTCPSRYRARGADGWGFPGWSAPLAANAAGRAALAHHLAAHDAPGYAPAQAAPMPDPLGAVRAWMRAVRGATGGGVGEWVADRLDQGDDIDLAATAAGAARWIAGFVRVLGWPLPDRLRLLGVSATGDERPLRWSAPGAPVTVAPGADARLGRVAGAGDFALVVHRVSAGDDGRVRDRAAFEAAAAALAVGIVPAAVVVTSGDTGERLRVPVDAALLDAGADLVVEVVRQRAIVVERGPDDADAAPSPACRQCPRLAACAPGRAWLSGPGRWRGGLPVA